ncbi:MAG TPA: MBG domain-containing protein [Acidobacteriaceae bacterium]|jgi:YVTN family beta-propeller protein|nr:MBG domain-containing protein [Acidobacteriaceae bacterium]
MKTQTLVQLRQQNSFTMFAAATAVMALACSLILAHPVYAQSIVGTVPVGTTPQGVAVDPVTNNIFVVNQASNTVTVLNGATGAAIGTPISVGAAPVAVALNPATGMVYVANSGSGSTSVSIINENNLTATSGSISVGVPQNAIAVDAASNTIVAISTANGTAFTMSGNSGSLSGTATVGTSPKAVAVNPVTHTAYVSNYGSGTVSVINETNPTTAGSVPVGSDPLGVAINTVTNTIYVANSGGTTVSVIDGGSNSVVASPNVGTSPGSIAANPVTNTIYVANSGSANVSVINGANNTVAATPAVGTNPYAVAVDSLTNEIFVLNQGVAGGSVSVVDGSSNSVVTTSPVGTTPVALALNPATNHAYIANSGSSSVSILAGSTNTTGPPASVPSRGAPIVVNPITGIVYASSGYDPVANAGDITAFKPDGSAFPCNGSTQTTCTLPYAVGAQGPIALAVNVATNQIIAANADGSITVVDGATNSITSNVSAPAGSVGSAVAIAVNPVTNSVYVLNQGNGSNANITAYTSAATVTIPLTNSFYPSSILVNPNTDLIYVGANDGGSGNYALFVIDGVTNTVKTSYDFASLGLIALNKNTGTVFGAGDSQITEILPNGTQQAITPSLGGSTIYAIAVDSASNTVYVAADNGSAAAINANDPTFQTSVVVTGTSTTGCANYTSPPCAASQMGIAVDDANNQIYVANFSAGNASVIDGASNSVVATVTTSAGYSPNAVAVDPVTHQAFVFSPNSADPNNNPGVVNTITPANVAAVPLTVSVQPASDPDILAYAPILQTTNPQPGFTLTPASSYTSSAPYSGITATNPTPTAVYYQVDTWQGQWLPASNNGGVYSTNIATALPLGKHILYSYAVYGREGTPESSSGGASSAPEIGQIQSTLFFVTEDQSAPSATTTTLTASPTSVKQGQSVALTATVSQSSNGNPVPGGNVTFTAGLTSLGSASVDESTGVATLDTTALPTGSDTVTATYAAQGNYGESSGTTGVTVTQPTVPTITWNTPAAISYGTTLSATQLNATASVAGTFVYTPAAGTTPAVGNDTLSVTFTPTDTTNYTTATATVTLAVGKEAPTITWNTPLAISYGTILSATQLDATASVAGTFAYTPVAGTILAAGNDTLSVTFTPTDTADYTTATTTTTLTVNKIPLTVVANSVSRAYGVANPTLTGSVNGWLAQDQNNGNIVVTYSTTATTSSPVGSYPITATVSGTAAGNYQTSITPGTLNVTQTASTLTWSPGVTSIVYGTPLGANVLDATVSGSVSGSITYKVGSSLVTAASILPAGPYTPTATFTPTDTTDYAVETKTANIIVTQAPLTVSVNSATRAYDVANPAFTATVTGLVNGDSVGGDIILAYTTTATTSSAPGRYPITATVSGSASVNYALTMTSGTLTIEKSSQTITFPAIRNVVYGVHPFMVDPSSTSGLLPGITVLSGPATMSGDTVFIQGVGTVVLRATQTGDALYGPAQPVTQTFSVSPASLIVTAQNASRTYGTANPTFAYLTSGFVNGDTQASAVTGTPILTTTATISSVAGNYPITVSAGTLAARNYIFQFTGGVLAISKAPAAAVLSGSPGQIHSGGAETFNVVVTSASSGTPTGLVTFLNGGTVLGTAALNAQGAAVYTTNMLPVGTDGITAQYGGDPNFSAISSNQVNVSVVASVSPNPTLTLGLNPSVITISQGATAATRLSLSPAQGYSGKVSLSCVNLPANVTCTFAKTSLQFSGNNQTQQVAITLATNADAQLKQQSTGAMAPAIALWWPTGITGLLFARKKRQRNKKLNMLRCVLTIVLLAGAGLGIMGCAGGGPSLFTTPAGTQTILIQTTNANGVQQSIPLQLTVTLN